MVFPNRNDHIVAHGKDMKYRDADPDQATRRKLKAQRLVFDALAAKYTLLDSELKVH